MFRRLTRPGRPPPNGLLSAKSMCFWESTRTMKDGTFTICFPTLRAHGGLEASEDAWLFVQRAQINPKTRL